MNGVKQRVILLLTIFLSLTLLVQGQDQGEFKDHQKASPRTESYGFVSANTRENLKLEEAIKNLRSAEEVRLTQETRDVACRLKVKSRINKSLGNWTDGTEHSLIFRIYSDEATMRYAAASLGKTWHQKTVLYFRKQAGGQARMYLISIPLGQRHSDLEQVVQTAGQTLDQAGVSYRTLVPLRTRLLVYIVDLSNELQLQVRKAAQHLHSRPWSFAGTGAFIGNDNDRAAAQKVFAQEMQAYESNHSLNRRCRQTGKAPVAVEFRLTRYHLLL